MSFFIYVKNNILNKRQKVAIVSQIEGLQKMVTTMVTAKRLDASSIFEINRSKATACHLKGEVVHLHGYNSLKLGESKTFSEKNRLVF